MIAKLVAKISILLALTVGSHAARGSTIRFGGNIIQSTQDGTGPAVNNPSLNNIQDLMAYTVTLGFAGSITAPGTCDLTGSSLTFSVPAAPAMETSFGFISLTITANAGFDEFSLLGCLTTGSGTCPPLFDNGMTANFKIPAAMLNSQNVAAIGLDQPHPLDLLEDDGTTDIHGSITTYSYSGTAGTVPEPSLAGPMVCGLAILVAAYRRRLRRESGVEINEEENV